MQVLPISSSKPTLEGLPNELIILILFYIPDQASLKSVVCSSPVFHQAYLAVRQPILCSILKTQFDSILDFSEAITAVRSEGLSFHSHKEEAICLLDKWRRQEEIASIASIKSNQSVPLHTLDEIIKVFRLYQELNYFLDDYAQNAPRPSWIKPTEWHAGKLPLVLSLVEKRRFLRALCRLQIFANVLGYPERGFDLSTKDEYWNDDADTEIENEAYSLFYGTLPLWEIEEMGCVWSYLMTKYGPISEEISKDLRRLVNDTGCFLFRQILPEYQRPPDGCHLEIVSQLDRFNLYFDKLASIGPNFLYRVLHAEHLLQRNMIMANARDPSELPFIGSGLGINWTNRFPFIYPADRHEPPNFQQLWSILPAVEQPNLGWKRAWLLPGITEGEGLEDVLFYDRPSEKDWDWGYAIWDAERLEKWKAPLLDEELPVQRPTWPRSPI
ncbi:uncharacterized protein BHQ10_009527 [Talaromyces amestolkiae]|uniref:F-box domain-containing protein n=1 Tax=Talaromyces amestolkiae TaxID=1196081 RepID=A0A364LCG1_TALAM|nr:uncharacterized protein BHQ10_009527 [Talaromyces amestolkiae]RAO73515.1 hypothetical protein BHQ10_009527 [Talaromyces amestolkiae]